MNSTKVLRFRIKDIEGPVHHGTLDQFHDYVLLLELDRGEPLQIVEKRVALRFTDLPFHGLASVSPSDPKFADEAVGRVAYYATNSLKSTLAFSGTEIERIISVTREEVDNMREIYPSCVDISGWHDVPKILNRTNRVFICCGQQTEEEIELGKDVVQAVQAIEGLDAYFAENQSSLEGVTSNIFRAIYTSSALIAIMHRRNQLTETNWRGSVWIEQEISIAAFLVQALGHQLPARVYVQKGIKREGVRGFIILNPIEFGSSDEVLHDLREWLPALADLSLPPGGD